MHAVGEKAGQIERKRMEGRRTERMREKESRNAAGSSSWILTPFSFFYIFFKETKDKVNDERTKEGENKRMKKKKERI